MTKIWPILLLVSMPFSASADYSDADCWTVTEIGEAPQNADLPLKLERVRVLDGGLLFPRETARHTLWRLLCLQEWPEMAQSKLDEQRSVLEFEIERERALVDNLKQEHVPPASIGVPWPNVLIAVGAALVVGGLVGGGLVIIIGK